MNVRWFHTDPESLRGDIGKTAFVPLLNYEQLLGDVEAAQSQVKELAARLAAKETILLDREHLYRTTQDANIRLQKQVQDMEHQLNDSNSALSVRTIEKNLAWDEVKQVQQRLADAYDALARQVEELYAKMKVPEDIPCIYCRSRYEQLERQLADLKERYTALFDAKAQSDHDLYDLKQRLTEVVAALERLTQACRHNTNREPAICVYLDALMKAEAALARART